MNDLSAYIEQQRAAGSFESAGSFTLALEKAVKKLSSHSLINPEDYVLKLVQCAVRLEVDELHIKLLKRSVLAFFELPAEDRTVSVEAMSRALAAPLEESNPARAYLAMAVCAVAGQFPKELMWGEWDADGQGTILSLAEGRSEVFQNAPFPRLEPLPSGRRFFLFFMTKAGGGLPLGQMAAEYTAITRRCAFAPMPIILDGAALGPSLPPTPTAADPVSELTSPYLGALEIAHREGPSLRWPPAVENKRPWRNIPDGLSDFCSTLPPVFRLRLPKGFQSPMIQEAKFSEISGVPIHLYGSSNLYYVKDGVILHPVKAHDAGGGAFAVLDGQHVKTDLTGLQVVQDASIAADIARVTETWKSQVDLMLSGSVPIYSNKPIYTRGSTLVSAFGCCLLGPLGLVAGPVYHYFSGRKSKLSQVQRKLTRQLEVRRGYLTYKRREREQPDTPGGKSS